MAFQTEYNNFNDFMDYRLSNFQEIDPEFLNFFTSMKRSGDADFQNIIRAEDAQDEDEKEEQSNPYLLALKQEIENISTTPITHVPEVEHPDVKRERKNRKVYTPEPAITNSQDPLATATERLESSETPSKKKGKAIKSSFTTGKNVYGYIGKYRISSEYGNRKSPDTGKGTHGSSDHKGVDVACPGGTKLTVPMGGIVDRIKYQGEHNGRVGAGHYIGIKLDNGKTIVYMHLQSTASDLGLKVGDRVEPGDIVGISGNSGGGSMGYHVHVGYCNNAYSTGKSDREWERIPNDLLENIFAE